MTGTVFDIKEFSVHDGPGSRVTVFLKGCPLRCIWCHNPEGLSKEPQLMYKKAMCTHCGRCLEKCDHAECQVFKRCVHVCPDNCIEISGTEYSAEELSDKLCQYIPLFEASGGGITFSGGEPLMQADFLCEVIDIIKKKNNVHIAVQTSGFADAAVFRRVVEKVDYVMMDIKIADREMHKKYTGVYNDVILKNFRFLKKSGTEYVVRIPLIPDITDTRENLCTISDIIGDSPCELLSYNEMASAKYDMLGMKYTINKQKNKEIDLKIFKNIKHFRGGA